MPAGARRDKYQAIDPTFQGFFGMPHGGDVMKDLAAPTMYGIDHPVWGAQAGDDNRHLVLGADFQIAFHTVIGLVDDEIDSVWGNGALGLLFAQFRQCRLDSA